MKAKISPKLQYQPTKLRGDKHHKSAVWVIKLFISNFDELVTVNCLRILKWRRIQRSLTATDKCGKGWLIFDGGFIRTKGTQNSTLRFTQYVSRRHWNILETRSFSFWNAEERLLVVAPQNTENVNLYKGYPVSSYTSRLNVMPRLATSGWAQ
jgi:hypothetical protein